MGRPRRPEYDSEEFRRLWYSRVCIEAIAAQYGTCAPSVHQAAIRRGYKKRREMTGAERMDERNDT